MFIALRCPTCASRLRVPDGTATRKTRCPRCDTTFVIPAGGETTSSPLATQPLRPASPGTDIHSEKPGEPATPAPDRPGEDDHPTVSSALRSSGADCQPDGTPWPADFSAREVSTYLLPARGADEIGRLGPYRVLKVLGRGGMGVVFLAEDPELQRRLAVKALKPGQGASPPARQRFLREARAIAAISHEHVVGIYHVGEANGVPFLVMPLLLGETLEDRLQREGRLPLPDVLRIAREMAEGLEAAHACGLIHRDVKPANVWLEAGRGSVKLLDFGLALVTDDEHLTGDGTILGTPAYMAPEQAEGRDVDPRSDLYSLGCVLYRMSTGELPFQGHLVTTLKKTLLDTPRPLAELNPQAPPGLSRLVAHLMAKAPADRPATARAVADTLRALARAGDVDPDGDTRPAPRSYRRVTQPERGHADRRDRRNRRLPGWAWGLACGVVLAVALVVALIVRPGDSPRTTPEPTPPPALPPERLALPDGAEEADGWQRFAPPGGRFDVRLPGEPRGMHKVTDTVRGQVQTYTFVLEVGPCSYAVGWSDIPGIVPQDDQVRACLDGGKKGLLNTLGAVRIVRDQDITLDGFPGKELVVENPDKNFTLTARMYQVRQRTYTLLASAPLGRNDTPEARRFFASFRLAR